MDARVTAQTTCGRRRKGSGISTCRLGCRRLRRLEASCRQAAPLLPHSLGLTRRCMWEVDCDAVPDVEYDQGWR